VHAWKPSGDAPHSLGAVKRAVSSLRFEFRTSTPEPDLNRLVSPGFPRDNRITRGPELQRVLKEGKRIRTRFLDVRIDAFPLVRSGHCRVGIIVPKAKHTAVERNRLKRRLRELSRSIILTASTPLDVVLLARGDSYQASFDALSQDVQRVGNALKALQADTE
jgi:ribonuclease P protein component